MMTKFKLIYLLFPLLLLGGCKIKKTSLEAYQGTKQVQLSQFSVVDSLYTKLYNIQYNILIEEETRDTAGRITNIKRKKLNIKDNSKELIEISKSDNLDSTSIDSVSYIKNTNKDVDAKSISNWIFPWWVWLILAVAVGMGIILYIRN